MRPLDLCSGLALHTHISVIHLKQNKAHSVRAEATHKGVNQLSKYVTQVQQQRPELPTVTITWHVCKYTAAQVFIVVPGLRILSADYLPCVLILSDPSTPRKSADSDAVASEAKLTQLAGLLLVGLAAGCLQAGGEQKGVNQQRLLEALVLRPRHNGGQQALVVGQVLEVQHARHLHQVGVAPVLVRRPRLDPDHPGDEGDQQHPVQVHVGQDGHCLGHQARGGDEEGGGQHPFVQPVHLEGAVGEDHLQVVDRDLFEGLQQQLGVLLQADGHHHAFVVLHRGLDRHFQDAVYPSPEERGLGLRLFATQDPEAENVVPIRIDADLNRWRSTVTCNSIM